MKELLFYLIIFFSNIIQGITGFAGTILAMSPSMVLVGYDVCKPILNVLGILAGVIIMAGGWKDVQWQELKKIIPLMLAGIAVGILIKPLLGGNMHLLYPVFGVFVLWLAAKGLFFRNRPFLHKGHAATDVLLLVVAGLVHGLFVSGGPLLIEYVSRKTMDRQKFRTTLSAVWVVLNSMILLDDIRFGYWNGELAVKLLCAVPFFWGGIAVGGRLCKKMSRGVFMLLTYVLMGFSGVMLLVK